MYIFWFRKLHNLARGEAQGMDLIKTLWTCTLPPLLLCLLSNAKPKGFLVLLCVRPLHSAKTRLTTLPSNFAGVLLINLRLCMFPFFAVNKNHGSHSIVINNFFMATAFSSAPSSSSVCLSQTQAEPTS